MSNEIKKLEAEVKALKERNLKLEMWLAEALQPNATKIKK